MPRVWQEVTLGTSPAAGANFALANSGLQDSRLLSVTFKLVTDANAANRYVSVDYNDGNGHLFVRNGIQGAVTAGTTALFSFNSHRTVSEANANNEVFAPLQPALIQSTQSIGINIVNIQAGDQLSQIVMLWERYIAEADSPYPGWVEANALG